MKTLDWILVIVVVFVMALFTGRWTKPKEKEIVRTTDTVSNTTVDTIFINTESVKWLIKYKDKIVYVPIKINDTTFIYSDSVADENVKIIVHEMVTSQGEITGRNIGYDLFVPKEIIKTNTVCVPTFLKEKKIYGQIGMGYSIEKVAISSEIGYNYKKNMYGVQYIRTSNNNLYLLKFGIKF